MRDADGAWIIEVAFLGGKKEFDGIEILARSGGEGVVGDSFDEAAVGFEDGFVGD